MPAIDAYLHVMIDEGASDLHLSSGAYPMYRIHGRMVPASAEGDQESPAALVERLLNEILPDRNRREYEETRDTDFAYQINGVARFRVNVFQDIRGMGVVFRHIPQQVLTLEELGMPPVVKQLCTLRKGLVLVTGPTGCGKSTTLAAMIDYINRERPDHIITIEDPVEFVHQNRNCLVNQREVRQNTETFAKALRAALREDPDIVLVGEMRDLETTRTAIETAETGHLVLATLHTTTAPSTVDRIIDQFPANEQNQIRSMLSNTLQAVITQTLLRRADGRGRVAALEILINTRAIAHHIREGKTHLLPTALQTGGGQGMQLLNAHLLQLVNTGVVAAEEAYSHSVDKDALAAQLRAAGHRL